MRDLVLSNGYVRISKKFGHEFYIFGALLFCGAPEALGVNRYYPSFKFMFDGLLGCNKFGTNRLFLSRIMLPTSRYLVFS